MNLAFPDYSTLFWITAVLAIFLVGVSKAGFGGGTGLIAAPLLALTIPVADAAALLLPLLIVADMFSISHYWKIFERRLIRIASEWGILFRRKTNEGIRWVRSSPHAWGCF